MLALGPMPLVIAFVVQLWQQRPHYQFAPVYLVALVYLYWLNRPKELLSVRASSAWQKTFLVPGLALFACAALLFSPWLGMVAWLLILPAAFIDLLPPVAFRRLLPVWLISWFLVPPPFHWDEELLQWLRTRTSSATGVVLDALGVIFIQAGNTFEVPGKQFFVEDACSGIHSLLSIVGVALLWAAYLRLPIMASLSSVICAAGAAVALNIVRVLAVVLAWSRWQLDLSKGWQHELLGLVLFVFALLFLASVQQFWLFWFSPLSDKNRRRTVAQSPVILPTDGEIKSSIHSRWLRGCAAIAMILWVPQLSHCFQMIAAAPPLHASLDPRQVSLDVQQQSLPDQLSGWKQVDYREVVRDRHHLEGEYSRQWTYQSPWGLVQVSFDFPFDGPHPLLRCYESTGWVSAVRRTVSAASNTGGFQEASLKRREFEVGSLIYGLWDDQAALVTPRAGFDPNAVPKPLLNRLWDRIMPATHTSASQPLNTYQFQVLVTGEFPIEEAQQAELLHFFLEARDHLRSRFSIDSKEVVKQSTSSSRDN